MNAFDGATPGLLHIEVYDEQLQFWVYWLAIVCVWVWGEVPCRKAATGTETSIHWLEDCPGWRVKEIFEELPHGLILNETQPGELDGTEKVRHLHWSPLEQWGIIIAFAGASPDWAHGLVSQPQFDV